MARSLTIYLQREAVPARAALQQAINALGFKLTVESDYVPFKDQNYLPFTLDGEDAGFALRFEGVADKDALPPNLKSKVETRDTVLSIRWGGDARERASALIFATVLAKSFDAVVHAAEEDAVYPAEELLSMVRGTLETL